MWALAEHSHARGCCQDSLGGSIPLWPCVLPPVTSAVVFDRTWMQAFLSIFSSNIVCFLHSSHYHPSQILTYCMLDDHLGICRITFLSFWQPPCCMPLLQICASVGIHEFLLSSKRPATDAQRSRQKTSPEKHARAPVLQTIDWRPPSSSEIILFM